MTSNRKLLLVSTAFFGYEKEIADAFSRMGFEVDLYDERPSNRAVVRAAIRLRPALLRPMLAKHFGRILAETEANTYDHIVVIKAETTPRDFLEQLRKRNEQAVFSLYTFDALKNNSHLLTLTDLFDQRFTFDPHDAASNAGFTLKPLFFGPTFGPRSSAAERRYELSFVGTLHSNRYHYITRLFGPRRDRSYLFLHVQARWYFFVEKYLTRRFREVDSSLISFDKLSKEQVADIFQRSVAVLDVQRFHQAGLTMRTFEALACGAKLITTNPHVRDMDFYDDRRILVLADEGDAVAMGMVAEFLSDDAEHRAPPDDFQRYSLDQWVKDFVS